MVASWWYHHLRGKDQTPDKTPTSAKDPDSINNIDSNWGIHTVSTPHAFPFSWAHIHTCKHTHIHTHTYPRTDMHAKTKQHNHWKYSHPQDQIIALFQSWLDLLHVLMSSDLCTSEVHRRWQNKQKTLQVWGSELTREGCRREAKRAEYLHGGLGPCGCFRVVVYVVGLSSFILFFFPAWWQPRWCRQKLMCTTKKSPC